MSWKRMPCTNTYRYVLAHVESQPLNAHLAAWFVRQMRQTSPGEPEKQHAHLAIDGKSLKSTAHELRKKIMEELMTESESKALQKGKVWPRRGKKNRGG
ncbi:MAG TPA: hypothetical protein VGF67_07090 [Ktedonobacteraceae bacterium]